MITKRGFTSRSSSFWENYIFTVLYLLHEEHLFPLGCIFQRLSLIPVSHNLHHQTPKHALRPQIHRGCGSDRNLPFEDRDKLRKVEGYNLLNLVPTQVGGGESKKE